MKPKPGCMPFESWLFRWWLNESAWSKQARDEVRETRSLQQLKPYHLRLFEQAQSGSGQMGSTRLGWLRQSSGPRSISKQVLENDPLDAPVLLSEDSRSSG